LFRWFIDDRWHLSAFQKLLGQIVSVVVFIGIGNISLDGFGDLLAIGDIQFGGFCYFITLFGMVGLINAFNLSDGLDGLAGGIGLISSLFLAVLAFEYSQLHLLLILIALIGVIFGFLVFNTHPAKLFMGDTGSLLIGFVLSAAPCACCQVGGIFFSGALQGHVQVFRDFRSVETLQSHCLVYSGINDDYDHCTSIPGLFQGSIPYRWGADFFVCRGNAAVYKAHFQGVHGEQWNRLCLSFIYNK